MPIKRIQKHHHDHPFSRSIWFDVQRVSVLNRDDDFPRGKKKVTMIKGATVLSSLHIENMQDEELFFSLIIIYFNKI